MCTHNKKNKKEGEGEEDGDKPVEPFIVFDTETPRSVIKLHSYYKVAGLLACVSSLLSSFPTPYVK